MKNLIQKFMALGLIISIFAACSPKNAGMSNAKVSKGTISGTWTVSDVRLEGFPSGYQVKTVFDMAPYQDFIGSTWTLYGGFGGQISLANGTTQEIYWSLYNDASIPTFQFKKIFPGEKAREVKEGYQLSIAEATKTSMILRSAVPLAGSGYGYVVYSFVPAQ